MENTPAQTRIRARDAALRLLNELTTGIAVSGGS